jgi:Uncharacterised protein family (UPF0175)
MGVISVDLPDNLLQGMGDALAAEASFLVSLKLYELGRISSAHAAGCCGLSEEEFISAAAAVTSRDLRTGPSRRIGVLHGFWSEVEPIVRHAFVLMVMEVALLFVGLIALLLDKLLPAQRVNVRLIEVTDVWLVWVLLCFFGVYTLLQVGVRLGRSLRREWRNGAAKSGVARNND